MQHLFVYGSLAPGQSAEYFLKSLGGTWSKAAIQARFFDRGWSQGFGYPGVVVDAQADWLDGYLFSSALLQDNWPEIDDYEGREYRRVQVTVRLEDQSLLDAFVYELVPDAVPEG